MSENGPDSDHRHLTSQALTELIGISFTVVSLAAVLAVHLTWLPLPIQSAGHLMTNAVGQEMRWTMFSSDPNGTAVYLWAEVELVDGTTVTWAPTTDVIGGDLRFYRPYRWVESVLFLEPADQLAALANWLEGEAAGTVTRVRIFGSEQVGAPPTEERPAPEVRVLWETAESGLAKTNE